ncbi:MAG TPA: DNA primase [Candidatus Scatomorpha pullicola]|mgnify:FL=1|nr:DNA primase [Candidatus Scatomorpha pullicola]
MAFSAEFLQELAERNPIEEVVGEYVALTKRSGQNLFGLCPFHSEKTPSFSVSPSKQIYHCFGCGKGGSVINFIMDIERLSFPDAVEFLAKRAGMAMPEDNYDPNRGKRERMLKLNREAARFFYEQLSAPEGQAALDYMQRRRISPRVARNFGLGFAPDSWDSLTHEMKRRGYTERELLDAGLVKSGKRSGVYDVFRNRLMFPVIDVRGNVVAFSGRILGDGEPKYLNSPDTLVFSKSHNLFGLNLAKKSKSGYIILVEGNVDVVSLHQAGFDSAVASLGTSLTGEQARLLSRYTKNVIICYDADSAGRKAAQRAIPILEKLELAVRVVTVPEGKDPDEFIKAKGAEAFRALIEDSENGMEFRLQRAAEGFDLESDDGKVGYLKEAASVIATLPDSVSREVYAMRVAAQCSVSADAVLDAVKQVRRRRQRLNDRQREREDTRPLRQSQPVGVAIKFENPASAKAEMGVIRLLNQSPELFRGDIGLDGADFSSPELRHIYEAMRDLSRQGLETSAASLGAALTPDEVGLYTRIIQEPVSAANGAKALADYIHKIESESHPPDVNDLRAVAEKMKQTKGYGG